MPSKYDKLEECILLAFQQALENNRLDVGDHLFYALEVLDPEYDGPALRRACRSIITTSDTAQPVAPNEMRLH